MVRSMVLQRPPVPVHDYQWFGADGELLLRFDVEGLAPSVTDAQGPRRAQLAVAGSGHAPWDACPCVGGPEGRAILPVADSRLRSAR
jgi:hypothetical protein